MYFTVEERTDGFGAQFQTMICSILILENSENQYIHTPIKSMEHNYDNDTEFISKVENCMNLINYNKSLYINDINDIHALSICFIINTFDSNINTYLNPDYQPLKNIKKCFWENKNKNFFNNNKLNVSVHIRRPNSNDDRIDGADTSLSYYFNIINIIKQKYHDKDLLFHIYSQNEINDYNDFDKTNLVFHLNENLFDTFIGLVAADILITSRSSFSYSASILSDGEIYYQPFWHPPGDKWIIC